jgi:anti-sigma B factor antagonist
MTVMPGPDPDQPPTNPPPMQEIAVHTEHRDTAIVLTVRGELDLVTAPTLNQAITAAIQHQPQTLVIDLSAVTFLGSVAMTLLVTTQRAAGQTTTLRVITGPTSARALHRLGMDHVLPIFPTLQQALANHE